MAKIYTVQVEEGRLGKDGSPSVGPVYRNALAKDCFPPLEPDMATSWDVFRYPRVRVCVCVCVCMAVLIIDFINFSFWLLNLLNYI
jgi:hypothetical protein